jgi:hypothetical protein
MSMEQEILGLVEKLQAPRWEARRDSAEHLYDLLDYGGLETVQQARVITALLDALPAESLPSVRESMLNTLSLGIQRYREDPASFAWENLRSMLATLGPDELVFALSILGSCERPELEAEIRPYLQHANERVREAAQEAIEEIQARLPQTREG